ncbi:hypothetical protein [Citrobacter freundii]|uniref:Uncharacterized protein n=1 Tax=Citrobacter freundii TaxID=546 RepID=A0A7G2IV96_CITFR|nr:hypothetical protein [Citrobacter freundii]
MCPGAAAQGHDQAVVLSGIARHAKNFGYYTSPASQKTPVARAQPEQSGW